MNNLVAQSIMPEPSLSDDENLMGLVGMLSDFTIDRRKMPASEIERWAGMYRAFLMVEREATVTEVFRAANQWLAESQYFPTVANLAPVVSEIVSERMHLESTTRAQQDAVPVPELPAPVEMDHANTRTADLPPGYDYADDPHWQAGIRLMHAATETKADLGPIGNLARDIAQKFEANQRVGFQGASKPRELVCPACQGARYLRLGGWDGHANDIGNPGSKYVMCRTCCPNGRYSEQAERDAARKAA